MFAELVDEVKGLDDETLTARQADFDADHPQPRPRVARCASSSPPW